MNNWILLVITSIGESTRSMQSICAKWDEIKMYYSHALWRKAKLFTWLLGVAAQPGFYNSLLKPSSGNCLSRVSSPPMRVKVNQMYIPKDISINYNVPIQMLYVICIIHSMYIKSLKLLHVLLIWQYQIKTIWLFSLMDEICRILHMCR